MNDDLTRQIAAIDLVALVQQDGVAVQRTGRTWCGRCPFHREHTPSFTVWPDGGGWYCFGCARGGTALDYVIDRAAGDRRGKADIAAGLATLGIGPGRRLTLPPLPPRPAGVSRPALPPPARPPDAVYPYQDADGHELYQVRRWNLTPAEQPAYDGATKLIRPAHPTGRLGLPAGVAPLLYRLPALLAADPAPFVFIPEGEKCADRLAAAGLIATCNSGGAGRWPAAGSPALTGRRVVILPDNDETGRRHADLVAGQLRPYAASVTILALPGLADHGDVSDFLAAGHTVDALLCLAAYAPALPAVDPETGEIHTQEINTDAVAALQAVLERVTAERDALRARQEWTSAVLSAAALDPSDRVGLIHLQRLIDDLGLPIGEAVPFSQQDAAARTGWSPATVSRQLDKWEAMGLVLHQVRPDPAAPVVNRHGQPLINPKTGQPVYRLRTYLACQAAPFTVALADLQSPPGKTGARHGGLRDCPACHADGAIQEHFHGRRCQACGTVYQSDGTVIGVAAAPPASNLHDASPEESTCNMQEGPAPPRPPPAPPLRSTVDEVRRRAVDDPPLAAHIRNVKNRRVWDDLNVAAGEYAGQAARAANLHDASAPAAGGP